VIGVTWFHVAPTVIASFLASSVEFVEALTVILAVGSVRGWRDTLGGTGAALILLLGIVAVLGSALTRVPLDAIQLVVGTLLLLFGMRWLRKAVLRTAGIIPLHDEAATYAKQVQAMREHGAAQGWDGIAFLSAFQITMLEGTEVVFIVIAVGAGGAGLILPASLGALVALLLVAVLGLLLHRPLSRVPENSLKFVVGVLLSAFGTFWVGEGAGIEWPGADWSIPALVLGFMGLALLAVPFSRTACVRAAADNA
jgi:Ca2+/H+ antiporter, TMEM165/GDT1 family